MRTGATSTLPAHPTTADVFTAARGGDRLAQRVVSEAAGHIARAVRGLVLAFGVQRVVVGGGVTRAGDAFMQPVLQALDEERRTSALVQRALPRSAVELLGSERNAGPLGAVAVARIGLSQRRSDERREVGSR
jgi:glucokinase